MAVSYLVRHAARLIDVANNSWRSIRHDHPLFWRIYIHNPGVWTQASSNLEFLCYQYLLQCNDCDAMILLRFALWVVLPGLSWGFTESLRHLTGLS